ncbi:MAG: FkbM family methyltransferase [Formivibrio sp.]|nr:FkbM family methyltransferase [Formivibrio sp.]
MADNLFQMIKGMNLPASRGILQVGASYGQELQQFLDNGVTHGVLIEPLPDPFASISSMCRQIPGFVAVNALCSDYSNKSYTFHVSSNGGMSSSILPPKDHLKIFDYVKFNETVNLKSTTVDEVITFLEINGHEAVTKELDTLYMDVQGAEYKVLLGSSRTLNQMNYVYMELIRGNLYEGMQSLANYCSLFELHGFTLNNLNFNAFHHADALFVKRALIGL